MLLHARLHLIILGATARSLNEPVVLIRLVRLALLARWVRHHKMSNFVVEEAFTLNSE